MLAPSGLTGEPITVIIAQGWIQQALLDEQAKDDSHYEHTWEKRIQHVVDQWMERQHTHHVANLSEFHPPYGSHRKEDVPDNNSTQSPSPSVNSQCSVDPPSQAIHLSHSIATL